MPLDFQSLEVPAGELTFTFPPADPWMAYLYVVFILFVIRLTLLGGPYADLLEKYLPKKSRQGLTKAFLNLRKTGALNGLYWLFVREIMTSLTPVALAISFRLMLGHPGRIGWSMESQVIFIAFVIVWVIADIYRILRIRRAIKSLTKSKWSNPKRMKGVMSTLGWSLNTLTSIANHGGDELSDEMEIEETKSKKALRFVRKQARVAKEKLESKVKKKIKDKTGMQWERWFRDILFSLTPLSLLYALGFLLS